MSDDNGTQLDDYLTTLATHFTAVAGREKRAAATYNLIRCHVVDSMTRAGRDNDSIKSELSTRFGVGTGKSADVTLSQIRRYVAVFNASALEDGSWFVKLPSKNGDLRITDADKVATVIRLAKGGDLDLLIGKLKAALEEGHDPVRALESARANMPKAPSKPRKKTAGDAPTTSKSQDGPAKAAGGTTRDNKTDAKTDDRSAFARLAEALAQATALAGDLGDISPEQLAALHDAYATLGGKLPAPELVTA